MASVQQSLFPLPEEPAERPVVRQPLVQRRAPPRLWLAVQFLQLPLDVRFRGTETGQAEAIIETIGSQTLVCACNRSANNAGVQVGMSLAAAWVLCPELGIHSRESRRETHVLQRLAAWCGMFTPMVSLEVDALLLEIQGSLKLFGGARRIEQRVKSGLQALGFITVTAIAPTPRAAQWLARAGGGQCVMRRETLAGAIGKLPVGAAGFSERLLKRFDGIGARTIADLLRLPRDGLARRFGPGTLNMLDQATGRVPDVREAVIPPPQFLADLDLHYDIESAQVLLHPANILLREFAGYLLATQQGVRHWRLEMHDRDRNDSSIDLGHAEATRDLERLQRVLEQRLENVTLQAPVCRIRLRALRMENSSGRDRGLFHDTSDDARCDELLDALRARCGESVVCSLVPLHDHRPELAFKGVEPGEGEDGDATTLPRPTWLLEYPEPLACREEQPRAYVLEEGPERIETGWWDGSDVRRDYWRARDRHGRVAWLFREQRTGAWYLHGYFS